MVLPLFVGGRVGRCQINLEGPVRNHGAFLYGAWEPEAMVLPPTLSKPAPLLVVKSSVLFKNFEFSSVDLEILKAAEDFTSSYTALFVQSAYERIPSGSHVIIRPRDFHAAQFA